MPMARRPQNGRGLRWLPGAAPVRAAGSDADAAGRGEVVWDIGEDSSGAAALPRRSPIGIHRPSPPDLRRAKASVRYGAGRERRLSRARGRMGGAWPMRVDLPATGG